MALPATGGSSAQVLQPGWNPLGVRYGQIVAVFIRDYLDANGNPRNLASASCGVGSQGVFTPFAADGLTIRQDLLWNSTGGASNQGWFNLGLTKEDSISVSPDQTVQQTPTAQTLRSVRNVYTKLEDKIMVTPLENSNLVKRLRFNLPLSGWAPDDGTAGYQLLRAETDVLIERQLILFLVDTDQQLLAEVYPRLGPDKTGKVELGRKSPYHPDSLSWDVLPDPYSQQSMWICEAGSAWNAEGAFNFSTTAPSVTPVTGLKANIVVPTPIDITSPTYTVALQSTAGGSFTTASLATAANDVQTVGVGAATAGTFTLNFGGQTTAAIAYNATSSAVQSALVALPDIGSSSNVSVTGTAPTWTVTFTGALGNSAQPLMTINGSSLTGGTTTITHTTTGSAGTGSVSGAFTTVQVTGLTASTTYNAAQVTATGSSLTVTSPVSAPFTSTAS